MGTVGFLAIESTLVYWIGRIDREKLDKAEVLMIAGSLEIASLGIKVALLEVLNFVPIAAWIAKVPIAAGIIEGIGALAINHFDDKYPGRMYTVDPEVERGPRR